MASKLTQAEKQRRAGVRQALKVAHESTQFYCLMYDKAKAQVSSDRAECLARVWAAEEVYASIRALLAPQSHHNSEKLRCSKRSKRHTRKRIKPALSASAYKKRGKGARG